MNTPITIKDYPCGSGKTTAMLESFYKQEKYLVITPYLSEVDRVIEEAVGVEFVQPSTEDSNHTTKLDSLRELLLTGCNVVSTHSLHERLVPLAEEGLLSDYNIIIDEVPDIVEQVATKSKTSIKEFYLDGGYIEVEENGLVSATDKWRQLRHEVSDTLNNNILTFAETGCLYLLGEHMFIWAMPRKLLAAGKSVTIMTYKSEGSVLAHYLKKLSVPCIIKSCQQKEDAFRRQALDLITLKDMGDISKLNLSHTGQSKGMRSHDYCSKINNALRNLKSRELKEVELSNVLLTCKKEGWIKAEDKAGVFSVGSRMFNGVNWIPNTTRGTNDYSHCSHLIYLYDQHINPIVARWLCNETSSFNDAYALTELIQWVWRSRIRKGEPITLYLPSPRMRSIFVDWLEGWDNRGFGEFSVAA